MSPPPLAPARYTRVAMLLHWLIALLILINVTLALSVDSLPEGWERPIIDTHKSIGITVLGLVLLRLLWRIAHRPPPLPASYPRWEKISAHLAHGLLYLLILALPISGWLHDSAWKDAATHPMRLFNLFPWPRIGVVMRTEPATKEALHTLFGNLHTWFGYALYVLFALHVLGALKHQFLDKEPELQRMLPWGKAAPPPASADHLN
ncbi:MAG: cytochrome b/b6 domain-containing protein [Steroidobacteraceae bacterium]|jgi:cytochrome b561